ncbi:MAG: four helix bundle protein [Bacillota bacterium]
MKSYRDLVVWRKAMHIVTKVYKITLKFPEDKNYILGSQLRRSAISIPCNIAEGYGRNSTNDYLRFLKISMGSVYELQTCLEIAKNLNFVDEDTFKVIYENTREIERMLSSLIKKLNK